MEDKRHHHMLGLVANDQTGICHGDETGGLALEALTDAQAVALEQRAAADQSREETVRQVIREAYERMVDEMLGRPNRFVNNVVEFAEAWECDPGLLNRRIDSMPRFFDGPDHSEPCGDSPAVFMPPPETPE